jgi:hypothetical protein
VEEFAKPRNKKETRFRGPLPILTLQSAVMAMPVMPARSKPDWRQFDIGDACRDVEAGLALHADRLQRI